MRHTEVSKIKYHLTIEEVHKQLNLEDDFYDDDTLLSQLIEDATQEIENYIESDISETSNTLDIYDFCGEEIIIKRSPYLSLTSISYLDSDDQSQDVTVANCTVRLSDQKISITLPSSITTDKLTVVYKTGYSDRAKVPSTLLRFILRRVADLYDVERGSYIQGTHKNDANFWNALAFHKKIYF